MPHGELDDFELLMLRGPGAASVPAADPCCDLGTTDPSTDDSGPVVEICQHIVDSTGTYDADEVTPDRPLVTLTDRPDQTALHVCADPACQRYELCATHWTEL